MRLLPSCLPVVAVVAACAARPTPIAGSTAVERGLAWLAAEVPRWHPTHGCFSCHHNGDAARTLLAGARRNEVLAETVAFLARPAAWDANDVDAPFRDPKVARVQFASALLAAIDAGAADDRTLPAAAALLAGVQDDDGSWRIDDTGNVGSPATYGTSLATAQATLVLRRAGGPQPALARAERWLRTKTIHNVPQASAAVLALHDAADGTARAQVASGAALLRRAQRPDGGFGPFVDAAAEPFDTALALLALHALGHDGAVQRARRYLAATQQADGSWVESTRPAGYESLAQRVSTSAWATRALLFSER